MIRYTALLRALATTALALSLCGCGGGGDSSITGRYGTLTFSATTDKASYNAGEIVNFTFTATNTGSSPVTVSGSGIFSVADPVPIAARVERNGSVVTRILNNNGNGTSVTIGPGESKTGRASWDQKDSNSVQVSTGTYMLTILLDASQVNGATITQLTDALAATPVTIVIH